LSLRARLPGGLRVRLLVLVAGLLLVTTTAAGLTARHVLLTRVDDRVRAELDQEVEEFRILAREGSDPQRGGPLSARLRRLLRVALQRNYPTEGESFYTYVDGRRFLTTARPAPDDAVLAALDAVAAHSEASRRGHLRIAGLDLAYVAVPVRRGGQVRGTFLVTEDVGRQRREVTAALRAAAGVTLAVLALSLVVAGLVLGRALRPLRALETAARAISETELTRRIEVSGTDEVARLGRTFNAMLDRLELAFDSQRQLVSDAGHELRTPITIVRGHLELLGADPAEQRETIALVTDELDRMGRLVDDLLTLAKAERPDFLRFNDVDVDVLTDELLDKAQHLGDRRWTLDARGAGRVTVDRQRLTQAVMALADNAVRHTGPDARIALGSALRDERLRLWVRDDGPGVPADQRERIFERFARAGARGPADGSGLGLAIVRAIAVAHGGDVTLSSRPGEGATFTVEVPASPAS
jgi:signal transduction histidine kinase